MISKKWLQTKTLLTVRFQRTNLVGQVWNAAADTGWNSLSFCDYTLSVYSYNGRTINNWEPLTMALLSFSAGCRSLWVTHSDIVLHYFLSWYSHCRVWSMIHYLVIPVCSVHTSMGLSTDHILLTLSTHDNNQWLLVWHACISPKAVHEGWQICAFSCFALLPASKCIQNGRACSCTAWQPK